jgi:hypothetical protein
MSHADARPAADLEHLKAERETFLALIPDAEAAAARSDGELGRARRVYDEAVADLVATRRRFDAGFDTLLLGFGNGAAQAGHRRSSDEQQAGLASVRAAEATRTAADEELRAYLRGRNEAHARLGRLRAAVRFLDGRIAQAETALAHRARQDRSALQQIRDRLFGEARA